MISIFLFYACSQLFVSVMGNNKLSFTMFSYSHTVLDNNELFLIMFIWKMMFLCWLKTVVYCLILIIRVSKFFFLTCCNSSDSSEIDISFQFYVLRFETIFFFLLKLASSERNEDATLSFASNICYARGG